MRTSSPSSETSKPDAVPSSAPAMKTYWTWVEWQAGRAAKRAIAMRIAPGGKLERPPTAPGI
ncbi:MAG: hypothetical protein SFY80_09895 [Verrucomicrobiota bacterium]|nr:hypothetical protein [Verrucomicrobiota bacterium]